MSTTPAGDRGAPTGADLYDLRRFVAAQDQGCAYDSALRELKEGHKTGHWIWFVFPQVAGLGQSATSRHFAISSVQEARAYLEHQVLGPRLVECAGALSGIEGRTAEQVLGSTDAVKLRSSMTLFLRAGPGEVAFSRVLERYFGGQSDPATDERLRALAEATRPDVNLTNGRLSGALGEQPEADQPGVEHSGAAAHHRRTEQDRLVWPEVDESGLELGAGRAEEE
jgi:uncharacterized protein (DUF1810 family)